MKIAEDLLRLACNGNAPAFQFMNDITEVFHFWDDLVDRDRPLTDADVNMQMCRALLTLPRNSFYQTHFARLTTLVDNSIRNWMTATTLEREGTEGDREIAFILRSSYADLLVEVAHLCGANTLEVAVMARRVVHKEGFAGYLVNLELERAARKLTYV